MCNDWNGYKLSHCIIKHQTNVFSVFCFFHLYIPFHYRAMRYDAWMYNIILNSFRSTAFRYMEKIVWKRAFILCCWLEIAIHDHDHHHRWPMIISDVCGTPTLLRFNVNCWRRGTSIKHSISTSTFHKQFPWNSEQQLSYIAA